MDKRPLPRKLPVIMRRSDEQRSSMRLDISYSQLDVSTQAHG